MKLTSRLQRICRFAQITIIALRYGLDEIILETHVFKPVRFCIYLSPWYWSKKHKHLTKGERIRLALEELGPIFVKFGQSLSTRPDIIPVEIAQELSKLQDQVPPFPGSEAASIIEQSLGKNIEDIYKEFDKNPMASASVAQVHAATKFDGSQVIVKIIRPAIEKTIRKDISILYSIAKIATNRWRHGKRLRPTEIVAEFEKYIFDELDLLKEAANTSHLRRNFADSEDLYIPEVDWEHTRRSIMTMERIHGVPIKDIATLKANNVNMKRLAEKGVEIFFTQVFRDNFFHADMHPGNIFIDISAPEDPKYIGIDMGITGSLSPDDKKYLAENFHAFFNRDYQKVAELHIRCGWVPADTRVDEFEAAIRSTCEPIFEKPLKDISFGALLLNLFHAAQRFNMEVQPQLILLQKTLLNIEGLGRSLYPDLDLWQTAKPFMEGWIAQQYSMENFSESMKSNLPQMLEIIPEVPQMIIDHIRHSREQNQLIQQQNQELQKLQQEIKKTRSRTSSMLYGATFIITAAIVANASMFTSSIANDIPVISWILGGAGLAIIFFSPKE